MAFTKNEMALVLASSVIILLIGTAGVGIATGFVYGDIKITQEQFSQAWQFSTIFAGAALMYFGFRAGQSNGNTTTQS
jgi:hypothetical protein